MTQVLAAHKGLPEAVSNTQPALGDKFSLIDQSKSHYVLVGVRESIRLLGLPDGPCSIPYIDGYVEKGLLEPIEGIEDIVLIARGRHGWALQSGLNDLMDKKGLVDEETGRPLGMLISYEFNPEFSQPS